MLRLILRNLRQKKLRTALTLAGLALATGTLFSLLAFQKGYERGLKGELEQLGAHILVVPKGCPYDAASLALHGANWPCFLKEEYLAEVVQARSVAVAAPVFMGARNGGRENRDVVVGITKEYLALKPLWRIQGEFPASGSEVLLGSEIARTLNGAVGGQVRLEGIGKSFKVAGILERTAGPDDDFIFTTLGEAQTLFKQPKQLTHVMVKLREPEMLDRAVQELRGCGAGMQMNIVPLAHLFETIRNVSASARYLLAGISAIAFLAAGTSLANTMLMAVLERSREIGVMRAIGASGLQIFWLFVTETLTLGILGAMLGGVLALIGARFVEEWIRGKIAYAPASSLIGLEAAPLVMAAGFAMIVACAAGLLPAIRAARLHPVQAFRTQASY